MEDNVPTWLNENFLSSCLQNKDENTSKVNIISFKVTPGVPAGNNYGSQILRVNVVYDTEAECGTEQSESLIIKAPITNDMMDFVGSYFEFAEPKFYYRFLPRLKELIKTEIAPKSYFSSVKNVIVLEDLKSKGYSMVNKFKQLDFDHCKMYFEASAKLHAGGIALKHSSPEFLEMFPNMQQKMMEDESKVDLMKQTLTVGFTCLVQSMESIEDENIQSYIALISKLIDPNENLMMTVMADSFEKQKNHLKSFLHADCWTTNMMFRYDESDRPNEIKLLDFQISSYDAVVYDVLSFTWMSANNYVLENQMEELHRFYCDTLNSTLAKFNCTERLSYERLKQDILERSFQVLMMIGVFLPFTQSNELLDDSTLFSKDISVDKMKKYYCGEHFYKKFPVVLELAAKQGVFKYLEDLVSFKEN